MLAEAPRKAKVIQLTTIPMTRPPCGTPRRQRKGLGSGFERDFTENTRLIGGAYRNSHYRTSVYTGA